MSISYPIDEPIQVGFFIYNPYSIGKAKKVEEDADIYIDDQYRVRFYGRFTKKKVPSDSYLLIEQHLFDIGREFAEDLFKFKKLFELACEYNISTLKTEEEPLKWKHIAEINDSILFALGYRTIQDSDPEDEIYQTSQITLEVNENRRNSKSKRLTLPPIKSK